MSVSPRRRRFVASSLVVCPLISGVFFGLVAAFLVLRNGSLGRGIEVGALIGGVMFASNAVALCIVQSSAGRSAPRRREVLFSDRSDARAS